MRVRVFPICVLSLIVLKPLTGLAQSPAAAPAPPAPPLRVTTSAGLALTSGNKDTSSVNFGYEIGYDPKARNVIKSEGLYLRGKTDGVLTADRLGLSGRDEYKLHDRAFAFGQLQYLQDQFKDIDYLIAPAGGLGYRLADSVRTKLLVDAGLGGVWEKAIVGDVTSSGAVTLDEKLTHQISATTTLSQTLGALYKTKDFGDVLYSFGASVATAVTSNIQLKVEALDTYKTRVVPTIEKNDVAVIVGMVFKR